MKTLLAITGTMLLFCAWATGGCLLLPVLIHAERYVEPCVCVLYTEITITALLSLWGLGMMIVAARSR